MATNKQTGAATGKGPRLAIGEIPEVQAYLDIKQELDALRADHPDIFMPYNDLVDRHNTALEAAEAVVRTRGVSCGPFENFSVSHKYNAQKMLDELGEELYLSCGGKIGTVPSYTLDESTVEAAIASGKIPAATIENFRSISRSYKTPKKIVG